jgi:NTP pyrophosphatase (non-canonical NTP hydrolase)
MSMFQLAADYERWMRAHHGATTTELSVAEATMRLLKVTEEVGEVAAAWVGATSYNPRKGPTHGVEDVVKELGDVVSSALIAIVALGYDPAEIMAEHEQLTRQRMFEHPPPGETP